MGTKEAIELFEEKLRFENEGFDGNSCFLSFQHEFP